MEKREHHVVKLLRNRLYPTFQLYAVMANKKTSPQDGLRLAALTVMEWLRQRLQDDIPAELEQPEPARFREVSDECLKSLHISRGFVVDIVSLPEQGLWTLQITEPDLGSDPGNPNQDRLPVPGRVIETNVGFQITGQVLECGFQSVISDPEVAQEKADVYRLVVARRLMKNPDFGLRQITALGLKADPITTVDQIKKLLASQKEESNQIPTVLFTYARREMERPTVAPPPLPLLQPKPTLEEYMPKLSLDLGMKSNKLSLIDERTPVKEKKRPQPGNKPQPSFEAFLPYDADAFAKEATAFCRTFLLADELLDRFNTMSGTGMQPGDILLLEPRCFGGVQSVSQYVPSKARKSEIIETLLEKVLNYPREKAVSFGNVTFISSARQNLMEVSRDALQQSEVVSRKYALDFAVQQERWNAALAEKEAECHSLKEQLARQREYQVRLDQEKAEQRDDHTEKQKALQLQIEERDQTILFLRRKLSQPKDHGQIAGWIAKNFDGRLLMHPKAISLLEDKSAQGVDPGLICDALDFLATDYWDNRYLRISEDEMNKRCSEKYGRHFEIKPTGENTINFTPGQYKIKYHNNPRTGKPMESGLDYHHNPRTGKPMESGLDYHLRVGGDPENLLRIYFLHDDEMKLIVVGSLPRHLRTMTIK